MNDADTIKFLEFHQNEPVLWDPTTEDYENLDSRAAAARRIESAMAIDGFTDVHVIIKFKNLRSPYSQEFKKILQSTKSECFSDDVHTPKVRWFKLMDSFLRPHVKGRKTQSNLVRI
ncbi:hypothetical protein JTB14_007547 [Gonioctena quinquepunctata]|nr:hypothetical protein JTB14_007547 [Gonioctena quinquepunctata]